jgi:hypothetical protein
MALFGALKEAKYLFIDETLNYFAINFTCAIPFARLYRTAVYTHNECILDIMESYWATFMKSNDIIRRKNVNMSMVE